MSNSNKYKRLYNTVAMRPLGQSKQNKPEHPANQQKLGIKITPHFNQEHQPFSSQDYERLQSKDLKISQLQLQLKSANQNIVFLKETNVRMMNKIASYERKLEDFRIIQDQLNFRRQQEKQMQEHMQNYHQINFKLKQKIVQLQNHIAQMQQNHSQTNLIKTSFNNQMHANSFQSSVCSQMRSQQQKNAQYFGQFRQNSTDKFKQNGFYALNSIERYDNIQKKNMQQQKSMLREIQNEVNCRQQQRQPSFEFFKSSQERNKSFEENCQTDKYNIRKQRKSIGSTNQYNIQKENHPITPKARVNIDFNLILQNHNAGGFQGKKRVFL